MIGSDYMNDNTIHAIYPFQNSEVDNLKNTIEKLYDLLDETLEEIWYQSGESALYKKVRERIIRERNPIT